MMKRNAIMMFIEALAVLVLVLSIVVLVAGRFQSFRTLPILTVSEKSLLKSALSLMKPSLV